MESILPHLSFLNRSRWILQQLKDNSNECNVNGISLNLSRLAFLPDKQTSYPELLQLLRKQKLFTLTMHGELRLFYDIEQDQFFLHYLTDNPKVEANEFYLSTRIAEKLLTIVQELN